MFLTNILHKMQIIYPNLKFYQIVSWTRYFKKSKESSVSIVTFDNVYE